MRLTVYIGALVDSQPLLLVSRPQSAASQLVDLLSGPINYMRVCVCAIIHAYYAHPPFSSGPIMGTFDFQKIFKKCVLVDSTSPLFW